MLVPIITEKSLRLAAEGKYTFRVGRNMTKHQIKRLVEETFGVDVVRVWTVKEPGEKKRTMRGKKRVILSQKKAIVALKEKQKIDLFEEEKKK